MFQNIKTHQVTGGTPRVGVRVNQHPPLVFSEFSLIREKTEKL